VIDGAALAALIGARKAASTGRSSRDVTAVASGLLDTLDNPASEGEPAFESSRWCSEITSLRSEVPVRADEATTSWLKENVEELVVDRC